MQAFGANDNAEEVMLAIDDGQLGIDVGPAGDDDMQPRGPDELGDGVVPPPGERPGGERAQQDLPKVLQHLAGLAEVPDISATRSLTRAPASVELAVCVRVLAAMPAVVAALSRLALVTTTRDRPYVKPLGVHFCCFHDGI